jgi:hypothetical protein
MLNEKRILADMAVGAAAGTSTEAWLSKMSHDELKELFER